MFTSRIVKAKKLDYTEMTDDQINALKENLIYKRQEAERVFNEARKLLHDVCDEYDEIMPLLEELRKKPPLPRQDSNHRGMD